MLFRSIYERETVTNIILVGENYPISNNMVDVTNMNPTPQIGWSYIDGVFSPPPPEPIPTGSVEPEVPTS